MKRYWHYFTNKISSDQLVQGSLVVFLGSTITSAINYLYHMVLGRMLGTADYGVFDQKQQSIVLVKWSITNFRMEKRKPYWLKADLKDNHLNFYLSLDL